MIEIRFRDMSDEPKFNIELAEKQGRIACDSAMIITFVEGENGVCASKVATINGKTLQQMDYKELERSWIALTATLANMPDVDNKFLKHICNLLALKQGNLLSIPDPTSESPS